MRSLFIVFLLFFSFISLSAQINDIYLVKSDKLNLRTQPNSKAESLGLLSAGFELFVLDVVDDWFKVDFNDNIGWVNKNFLIPKKENSYLKLNLQTGDSPDCENMDWLYDINSKSELKIVVGKGVDFAVKIMNKQNDKCIRAYYIRSGENVVINQIPSGMYYLKIASGLDYRQGVDNNKCLMVFNRNAHYTIGRETLDYKISPKRIEIINGEKYEVEDIPKYELFLDVPKAKVGLNSKDFNSNKITAEQFNQ